MKHNDVFSCCAKRAVTVLIMVFIGACARQDDLPEKDKLSQTKQAATVDLDESYVVMGNKSVQVYKDTTVYSGNIAVNNDQNAQGESLVVYKKTTATNGTAFIADRMSLAKQVEVSKVYYKSELLADEAEIGSITQVSDVYFPVFPQLPSPKAANPGSDEQGNPDQQIDLPHHEELCLKPGVYGSITVGNHATLRFAFDCDDLSNTTEGSFELRDLEVESHGQVTFGPGSVEMRDIEIADHTFLTFQGPVVRARDYVGLNHSTLILGPGEAHFRNFLTHHHSETRFSDILAPIDICIKDWLQIEHHNDFNANTADEDPEGNFARLVRIYVNGKDGDCPFIYQEPLMVYPCTTDKTAKIGDHSEVRANIMVLADDQTDGTIEISDHTIAIGSYFADRVIIDDNVQLTNRNGLMGLDGADPSYLDGDIDNDGVADEQDNCLADPNPEQNDQDGDWVGDVCDNCPEVPNPKQERAYPDDPENDIGAACVDPPLPYCGDGVVQAENNEECDDGFEQNGSEGPCSRLCELNPPRITEQPQDQAVVQNQPASFSVQAVGHFLQYQWLKNGQNIPDAYSATYQIEHTALEDDGNEYSCVVSNSAGSEISEVAILTVWECDEQTYVSEQTECGIGACHNTGMTSCIDHKIEDSCTPGEPAADDTLCNGIDDDCSGETDEDYISESTSCGVGACAATGNTSCVNGEVIDSCTPGVPAADDTLCNGIDDDCSGETDEDYVSESTSCGVGACAATGSTSCVDGGVVDSCTPGEPAADDTLCNGIDDDCSGETDEDYVSESTSCGIGACAATGSTSCVDGGVLDSCTPGEPAADDTLCNGIDDDCSGETDEDYISESTSCGIGACAETGSTSCVNGEIVDSCTPGEPAADDTLCNGIDDDCSGETDEDYVSESTSCGVGACATTGNTSCVNGEVIDSCTPGEPAADDTLCNGVDDDCSGETDEDYISQSTSCGVGACAATGSTSCVDGGVVDSCTPGEPAADDTLCNGIDDDCNGETDEDYVSESTSCGIGACATTGNTSCVNGEVVDSCTPGQPATNDQTCDNIDDDCNGEVDEDYVSEGTVCGVGACYANGATSCVDGQVVDNCVPGIPADNDQTCDGIDDDCDEVADEDYVSESTSCGIGACAATGNTSCVDGLIIDSCTPGAPAANDETCNDIDDDCDQVTDEDYVSQSTACGVGACAATGDTSCVGGQVVDSCTPGTPAANDESCDSVDDDCDGLYDEDYVSENTTCGVGACASTGVKVCQNGQEDDTCTAGSPADSDESCDNVDDDCNGQVDDGFPTQATSCGVGACAATGSTSCVNGQVVDSCTPGQPADDDSTCDGVDDDCDGSADEDYLSEATACGVGACASTGVKVCQNGQEEDTCTAGSPADSDESCDNIDDDCNGQVDDGFPTQATSCGVGACAATGSTSCIDGQVEDSCTPGEPAADDSTCDGIDSDCDGEIDEDCPPEIITHPEDVTVSQGESFSLEVAVTGSNLEYQWQRYERDIEGATDATYSKQAVFSDYGAVYRCVVSNPAGTVISETATVLVIDELPPVLNLDGPDQRTTEKDFITITGYVSDTGSGISSVMVAQSPSGDQAIGAVVNPTGAFSAEIPLEVGENQLYVIATDAAGNQASQALSVYLTLSRLPRMIITEPISGSFTMQHLVDVKGYVRSSLPADQIRMVLGGEVRFPTGHNGEYQFAFTDVALSDGVNQLVVRAETAYGSVSESVIVFVQDEDQQTTTGPLIELSYKDNNVYLKEDLIHVSGIVAEQSGVDSIFVYGEEVPFVGTGSLVSFAKQLSFAALGVNQVVIVVKAFGNNGTSSQVSFTAHYDPDPPVLEVLGLQPDPEVNNLTETPYHLSGTIDDANLAGLVINNQNVPVTPAEGENTWSFEASVPLIRQETKTLQVLAWDLASNYTQEKYQLNLDVDLDIEIIKPKPGAEHEVLEPILQLEIAVRIPGIADTDSVVALIDTGEPFELSRSGVVATGTVSVLVDDNQHKLTIKVIDQAQAVLATQTAMFSVKNAANVPLTLIRQEPGDQSQGSEANVPIVLYFNRPFDPDLLKVNVTETAHGMIYQAPKAADIRKLSVVDLVQIDRDNQPVPGGLSYLPGNRMVAFYPDRDYAYGGTVFIEITHGPEEDIQQIARTSFGLRRLHTLVQGFVNDHEMNPLQGIVVEIDGLGYTAKTDREGVFYFGYGEPAEKTIPPGRHKLIVNPDRKQPDLGTVERYLYITAERINRAGMALLPRLDGEEPFRYLSSGDANVVLVGGELSLDLTDATIYFPDGNTAGEIHAQKLWSHQMAYMPLYPYIPSYAYVLQPAGIEVKGHLGVSIKLPARNGDYTYLEDAPSLALFIGLDSETLTLRPVGLGRIDKEQKTVVNIEPLRLTRLDYLTYAVVRTSSQHHLEAYEKGEIGFEEMISKIASDQ